MVAVQPDQPTAFTNSPDSATSVPSERAPCLEALDGRVAVAGCLVLLAPGQRTADGPAGPPRELGGDERVVAGAVLRSEAAAHELADHTNLVGRQAQLLGDLVAHAPDELGRDVDVETVALPLADRLVGLHRVVEDGLGPELGLDDGIGFGEAALYVAALVPARRDQQLLAPNRLVGVEDGLQDVPVDVDQRDRVAGGVKGVRRDRCYCHPGVARLVDEHVQVVRPDRGPHTGGCERAGQVDALHARVRVRGAEDRRVQHPGQLDVCRVASLAARALGARDPRRGAADDFAGPGRPLVERVLLDHEPHVLVAALDLLLGLDQSRQERIASSILG